MTNIGATARWGVAILAFLLSPLLVIFSVPLAIGFGIDVVDTFGGAPIAIALSLPGTALIVRRALRETPLRGLFGARPPLPLGKPGRLTPNSAG